MDKIRLQHIKHYMQEKEIRLDFKERHPGFGVGWGADRI